MTYLIDGYNFLHAIGWANARMNATQLRLARQRMLDWLEENHPHPDRLIIIFDAQNNLRKSQGEQLVGSIRVHYAHRMLADDLIAQMVRESTLPQRITVVSNDNAVQEAARRRGSVVWRSEDLIDEMQKVPSRETAKKPDHSAKPDQVSSAEVEDYLHLFGEVETDIIDRKGFNAPE